MRGAYSENASDHNGEGVASDTIDQTNDGNLWSPWQELHVIAPLDHAPVVSVPVLSSTKAYRSLGRALRLTRVAAAPDVVPPQDDASQDGLGGDGCRDRFLHAELKLLAKNPPLRARAPREPCTRPIKAHGKQFFIAALEEVGSLAIIRCISHGCLFEDAMERPKQWADFGESALSLGYVLIAIGAHLKQGGLGRVRS